MNGSLVATILFVVSCIVLYAGLLLKKKSNNELNGVSWLILSVITVFCYVTVVAGVINIVRIPVNIWSIGIIYLITGIFLLISIKKENECQKYVWEKYDFFCFVVFAIIIFLVAGSYFTPSLKLMYYNSDAAVHFKNAMYVLRNQRVVNMYFAPLHNALIMECFMAFVPEVFLFKVYILVDAAMFLLESMFFIVLIRDYLSTKAMKVIGLILAILYMFGYPMNSFLFSFFYWSVGVMLIGYVLLMLRYYENEAIERRYSVVALALALGTIPVTYMLFGPFVFIATFMVLVAILMRQGKLFTGNNVLLALKIFLIPTVLAIYYCYVDYLMNMDLSAGEILTIDGGIYREIYINFIWVLPFVIYSFIKALKDRRADENIIFTLFFVVITIAMFMMVMKGKMSSYYFFKFYFPIWMLFFVLSVQAVSDLWMKSKEIIVSCGIVFLLTFSVVAFKVESNAINSGTGLSTYEKTGLMFDLYRNNVALWKARTLQYPDQYFDICNYVIEEIESDKEVPLLATIENYNSCYWYEGITGNDSSEFYGWHYSLEEVQEKLANGDVDYFVVYKNSPIYIQNAGYFMGFEWVYDNELGFVAKIAK